MANLERDARKTICYDRNLTKKCLGSHSMLRSIAIENFYCMRDRVQIDFTVPQSAPDQPCFKPSRTNLKERYPVVIALFGPNASGKSTVLRAITSLANFAVSSFELEPTDEIPHFQPFMSERNWLKPTKITVEFEAGWLLERQIVYRYEVAIANHGPQESKTVHYEALFFAPEGKFRRVFVRENLNGKTTIKPGDHFDIRESDARLESVRPNSSVISTLAKLNHGPSTAIWKDLKGIQTNLVGRKYEATSQQLLHYYLSNKTVLDSLNHELNRIDVGLNEMFIRQGPSGLFPAFEHDGLDLPILFDEESHGTQRFLEVFARLHFALATGQIAIIDELDADLHPLLIPELFRWFEDPDRNPYSAQLLITAHNASLMDELEKEQIFFTDKDRNGAAAVFGARDIKGLRRQPSLMKKYLGGRLGAVPQIG